MIEILGNYLNVARTIKSETCQDSTPAVALLDSLDHAENNATLNI